MVARKWDKEKVLELIMSKSENGFMPKYSDFTNAEAKAIYDYAGNFGKAAAELGLKKKKGNYRTKYTKEDVLQIVANRVVDGKMPSISVFSSYEKKLIYRHFDSIENARHMLKLSDQNSKTMQGQARSKNPGVSLCWSCQRSAAPIGIRCSWDEKLEIPEGAEYVSRDTANVENVVTITKCPLYVSIRQKSLAETAISN